MRQFQHVVTVTTAHRGLYEITDDVAAFVAQCAVTTALLTIFCRHTSASLIIQENADPSVQRDLEAFFETIAPEDQRRYIHASEGPDDMPAHIRAALTQTHLAIPVADGALMPGTWQGIYVFEHRRAPHRRDIVLHLIGA